MSVTAKYRADFSHCDKSAIMHLATQCASHALQHNCFVLTGNLGAGKTFFASCFIPAFLKEAQHVTSPTFAISQAYYSDYAACPLWHFDLYRLEYIAEVEETGLLEALDQGVTLIEWADIAQILLPDDAIHIIFAFEENSDYRTLTISGDAPWIQKLKST
jgi:tRNA threonylcarbamoyladenosine biosynthesis protein TsaE